VILALLARVHWAYAGCDMNVVTVNTRTASTKVKSRLLMLHLLLSLR
jgi:hypothetical protein